MHLTLLFMLTLELIFTSAFPTANSTLKSSGQLGGKNLMFGIGVQYGDGGTPSIAIDDAGHVIEARLEGGHLKTRVAIVTKFLTLKFYPDVVELDSGVSNVDIAVNNKGQAVVIFQKGTTLYYRVGSLSTEKSKLSWQDAKEYDKGRNPSVTLTDDGIVIEVHETNNAAGKTLWYHIGPINGATVGFGGSHNYQSGKMPTISANSAGVVVELHKSEGGGSLWYLVGQISPDKNSISWSGSVGYTDGYEPSVSLTALGFVCEAHQSSLAGGGLFSQLGSVNGQHIDFNGNANFDKGGKLVSIACNAQYAVQVHMSQVGSERVWYSVSLMTDRKEWMAKEASMVLDRPLWQVTLPGTHDSGTYKIIDPFLVLACSAQSATIYEQLVGGIRYFDLRPDVYMGKELRIQHTGFGPLFEEVINDVRRFLGEVSGELVILEISHFKFDAGWHAKTVEMVKSKLGPFLASNVSPSSSTSDLLNRQIRSFVASGPHVIIVYQDNYIYSHPENGFVRTLGVYDSYANTGELETMKDDQYRKYQSNFGASNHLFLLSYTLTGFQEGSFVSGLDIHDMSKPASRSLADFIAEKYAKQKPINVLYVDFFAEGRNTDIAIAMNRDR